MQVLSGVQTVLLPFVNQLQVTALGEHKGHGILPLGGWMYLSLLALCLVGNHMAPFAPS